MNDNFTFRNITFTRAQERAGLRVAADFTAEGSALTVRLHLENVGTESICVGEVPLFGRVKVAEKYEKTYSECRDLLGELGINAAAAERISYGILGYTDDWGRKAVLFGFTDFSECFYKFVSVPDGDGFLLSVFCDLQGVCLVPGEKFLLSDLKVCIGSSVSALLEEHARRIAQTMRVKRSEKPLGLGWCSWYYYYGTENRENIFENMVQLQASPLGKELGFILIDDGWNQKQDGVCVWGDWTAGFKFREGMEGVCDAIHRAGLRAGLWLAPFAVSTKSELYAAHPDWVIGGKQDILNPNEGVLGLDLSNPAVLSYIREVFTRVFDDWGFDHVKIDFLQYAVGEGKRYDAFSTGVQAFRKGLQVIRECAKDKFVLNCGSPVLQSAGLCDGMRIGSDVGSHWYFPLNEGGWPYGNCNIKSSVRYAVFRNWMHAVFWSNDPDCIMARAKSNRIEYEQFLKFFPYMEIREEDFGLSESEAALWIKLVAFTGGIRYLSEKWSELPPKRQKLIGRYAQMPSDGCTLVDCYVNHDVFVLRGRRAGEIGIFNISDEDVSLRIPASGLGRKGVLRDADSGEEVAPQEDVYAFPVVRARSCSIFL